MARPKLQKSWIPRGDAIERRWFVVDAADIVVGRLATRVATVLMGKHKPTYTPFRDMGDHVIVINAAKAKFSGEKMQNRVFMWYSGYKGGEKFESLKDRFAREPQEVIRSAVEHMLPKTTLGKQMAQKLKVYRDDKHGHAAQKPVALDLKQVRKGRLWLSSTSGAPAGVSRR
jgi:large subunit ribosomal protein L13